LAWDFATALAPREGTAPTISFRPFAGIWRKRLPPLKYIISIE
jgi:hypothetical protein